MSRSGYSDECEYLDLYRGNVERTIKGKRGQAFLREMAKALDEMPEKKLISGELVGESGVCAIGAVCKARGLDVRKVDEFDPHEVADLVGISTPLAAEIAYLNDDNDFYYRRHETPEERWQRMRKWVQENINA